MLTTIKKILRCNHNPDAGKPSGDVGFGEDLADRSMLINPPSYIEEGRRIAIAEARAVALSIVIGCVVASLIMFVVAKYWLHLPAEAFRQALHQ